MAVIVVIIFLEFQKKTLSENIICQGIFNLCCSGLCCYGN